MPSPSPRGAAKLLVVSCATAALVGLAGCADAPPGPVGLAEAAIPADAPVAAAPGPQRDERQAAPTRAPDLMTLGDAAPAPLGYLRFCARRPDQCGIDADPSSAVAGLSEASANALVARYYWSVAFADQRSPDLRLRPTSGDAQPIAASSGGRLGAYDWSSIFGSRETARLPPPAAPAAPPPIPAAPAGPWRYAWTGFAGLGGAQPVAWLQSGDGAMRTAAWGLSDAVLRSPYAGFSRPAPLATMRDDSAWPPTEAPRLEADQAPQALAADRPTLALLDGVNRRINRAIRYISDAAQYGADDFWTLPLDPGGSAAGDCKDYVLEKRRALVAAGVPAADLSIAIVRTGWGEAHAVLLVLTDRGELVMDSLSQQIQPWRKVRYTWIERQAPGQALSWVKIRA